MVNPISLSCPGTNCMGTAYTLNITNTKIDTFRFRIAPASPATNVTLNNIGRSVIEYIATGGCDWTGVNSFMDADLPVLPPPAGFPCSLSSCGFPCTQVGSVIRLTRSCSTGKSFTVANISYVNIEKYVFFSRPNGAAADSISVNAPHARIVEINNLGTNSTIQILGGGQPPPNSTRLDSFFLQSGGNPSTVTVTNSDMSCSGLGQFLSNGNVNSTLTVQSCTQPIPTTCNGNPCPTVASAGTIKFGAQGDASCGHPSNISCSGTGNICVACTQDDFNTGKCSPVGHFVVVCANGVKLNPPWTQDCTF